MGRRGPAPKPAALLELSGRSHKKKQPPPKTLEVDAGETSDYKIIPSAQELWDSLVKAGVAKRSDRLAFLRLEKFTEIYFKAAKSVDKDGYSLGKNSELRFNPAWRVMLAAHIEILKLEMQFGLTPSSKRAIMQPLEAEKEDGDGYAETRRQQKERRRATG